MVGLVAEDLIVVCSHGYFKNELETREVQQQLSINNQASKYNKNARSKQSDDTLNEGKSDDETICAHYKFLFIHER